MNREIMTVIAAKFRVGRVFSHIRRCLIANDGNPMLISQLLAWCYPRTHARIPPLPTSPPNGGEVAAANE
jgi:hypothetical protein